MSSGREKLPELDPKQAKLAESSEQSTSSDVEATPQPRLERVPRSERRGLLSSFLVVPEVRNPYQYSNATKWLMTATVALAGTTSSTGSSIFYRK